MLLLSAANLALEVPKKQSIYQDSWETFRFYETFCNQTSNDTTRYERDTNQIGEALFDCRSLTADHFNDTVPEYSKYLCNHMACDGKITKFYSSAEGVEVGEEPMLYEDLAPPSYFGKNISKLLFSTGSLNLFCLLFLGEIGDCHRHLVKMSLLPNPAVSNTPTCSRLACRSIDPHVQT